MRGLHPVCNTCEPCEQDACTQQAGNYGIPAIIISRVGCCDCNSVKYWAGWNFSASEYISPNFDPCGFPSEFRVPADYPKCLSARLDAHGGFKQIEIYLSLVEPGLWPEYQQTGIPHYTSDKLFGIQLLNRNCEDDVLVEVCEHWEYEGFCAACEESEMGCDFRLIKGRVGFIVRAQDGWECYRSVRCLNEGADSSLSSCSSSSSSSSSNSSSTSSSSGSSTSSSSGSSVGPGDDDGSSSSGSSGGSSDGSSSSGGACSCYVRITADADGNVTALAVFDPEGCAPGTGSYEINAGADVVTNTDGIAAFAFQPCETYAITATYTAPNGTTCTDMTTITIPCSSSGSSDGATTSSSSAIPAPAFSFDSAENSMYYLLTF